VFCGVGTVGAWGPDQLFCAKAAEAVLVNNRASAAQERRDFIACGLTLWLIDGCSGCGGR